MTPTTTVDASRRSWIATANSDSNRFPLQHLPYAVFGFEGRPARIGVGIGDNILDLHAAAEAHLLPVILTDVCSATSLNPLLSLGPRAWSELRLKLSELLGADTCSPAARAKVEACLLPMKSSSLLLPASIGDYTDFYASIHHATRVGALFRPEQPLLPNYRWLPIGYHGRASSIIPGDTPVHRPRGQTKPGSPSSEPIWSPTQQLDYELELAAFVGPGNSLGHPIPLAAAHEHLFGVTLMNDWSARDLQTWESQPLGPFLAKSFATSISPWVTPLEALAPFRVAGPARSASDPAPLAYLQDAHDTASGALNLTLEVWLQTASMRAANLAPHRLSQGNFASLYWTLGQLLAHHTSNGCNLRPGDLLGSGTVSGPEKGSEGCLLEMTRRGAQPLQLPNGETRRFLEDGDEVILRGYAERPGYRRIDLGDCRGVVLPAS